MTQERIYLVFSHAVSMSQWLLLCPLINPLSGSVCLGAFPGELQLLQRGTTLYGILLRGVDEGVASRQRCLLAFVHFFRGAF